jgi:hypothetical protein
LAAILLAAPVGCSDTAEGAPYANDASPGGAASDGGILGDATSGSDTASAKDGSSSATGDARGDDVDPNAPDGSITVVTTLDIADVWSGHPVGFALVTRSDQQFVAFYDADRNMTVASRKLDSQSWQIARLGTVLGWDSHNYVTMAIDDGGFLHVAGNMHAVPLIYFRTQRALDPSSFQRVTSMVGTNEQSCTYPQFFRGPSGDLIFMYRDGVSGNGNLIIDTYDLPNRAWKRLLDTPLTDGQGLRNAYPVGPIKGPDGLFHLVWTWRETPNAETNHDLSYARSRDLVHWENAAGQALALPITLASSDIVDPVLQNGGMINNNTKVGFDAQMRPVVGYHKFDENGNTQIYNARFENGKWTPHKTSDWTYRWNFSGAGTLVFEIELDGVQVDADGSLTQAWYHKQYGGFGAFLIDPATLHAAATIERRLPYPKSLDQVESSTPGMVVRWSNDTGSAPDPKIRYMLRWETLESNRDMPRAVIPPPTKLRLYGFSP